MKVTLALAQINTKLGDMQTNLEKHLALAKEAWSSGADILLFPELSLTGYVLQDLVPAVARRPQADDSIFKALLKTSQDLDLVVGFVEEDPRHRFYIANAYLSQGEIVHIHRKVHLPTYTLFDEKRYLAPGDGLRAFDTRFGRLGMLICEDFWHISSPYLLWVDGADLLLMSSASPGRGITGEQIGSAEAVETMMKTYAQLLTVFVAHTNRVGFEDGLKFWGGATVYDPDGTLLTKGPYDEESLTLAELDLEQLRRTRTRLPLLRDERPELVRRELERILRHD